MRFIFSGTGTSQGIPVIGCDCEVCISSDDRDKRLRTSGLLEDQHTRITFDTGPDFRQQMLKRRVTSLDAVVFTHQHKDHTGGLDDIRAFNYQQGKAMDIYANADTIEHLHREYYYIFENKDYPGIPLLNICEVKQAAFCIGTLTLIPIPIIHGQLPILGYRCGKFAYITDASHIPESSLTLLEGIEILVLNALRKKPHHSHFHLEAAIQMAQQLGVRRAYFTHISHLMGKHEEIEQSLPEGIFLGYDGMVLEW